MTGEELKQQIALYESADHTVHLDVKVDEDTVWLNRQQLALLFGRDIKTIGKHVGNVLREELNGFSVVAKFATTASDGKTYQVEHYNLDMILSVGYRVKSKEGIYFRRWANSVLKQHLVDGYTPSITSGLTHFTPSSRCYRGPPNRKLLAPQRSWNDICRVLCCLTTMTQAMSLYPRATSPSGS